MHAKDSAALLVLVLSFFTGSASAERVSVNSKGNAARGDAHTPVISADGRFVAFATTAKLVPEDTNGITDVYVHDRTTNRTRLLSDQVGGDQPTISANGRYVAFRSFEYYEGLPRIRMVDLERGGPSFSGSVQNLNSYYQPADAPVINPNGRFLAFAFRPAPNRTDSSFRDHEITVVDLVTRVGYAVLGTNTAAAGIADLGRFAMSADAKTFVFETTAALTPDDTNGVSDIYLVRRPLVGTPLPEQDSPPVFQRLSRRIGNGEDSAKSYDPVISLDGSTAFFISDAALTAADTDGTSTIYAVDVSGNPANLRPVPTRATPVALARDATISGKYLGYLGRPQNIGSPRPYMVNVGSGVEIALAAAANGECEAPVLSGDDHFAAYASTATNLVGGDNNRSFDVFVESPRNAPAARTAPQVVLAVPADGDRPQRDTLIKITSNASDSAGLIRMHTFEFNGVPGVNLGTTSLNTPFTPGMAGLFTLQTRAFNDAWIEGRSDVVNLTVREPNITYAVAGIERINRTNNADGSTNFDMTLAIENRGDFQSPALTLLVTAASTPFSTNSSVDLTSLPLREEQVIAVVNVAPLTASERRSILVRGVTPPTENFGNAQQGLGWTIIAKLRSGPTLYNTVNLFQALPRLSEQTFLPNGGIPLGGNPNTEAQFNPNQLQEIQIQGRAEVVAGTRANYSARAVFSTGTKACVPTWSVQGASSVSIGPDGVLNARNITSPANVTVQAAFSGRTATRKVRIRPISPKVSIRAEDAEATENGDPASFRILRTPVTNQDLTVNYQIGGSAKSGQDYAALSGSAVIPAGASSVKLDLQPLQDVTAEGDELAELTLLPDPAYRLSAATEASAVIIDDEPFPTGQPDGILQYGDEIIGTKVIDPEFGPVSGIETSQHLEILGRKDRTERFVLSVVNRDAGPTVNTYTVTGASSALGFEVKYLVGDQDVTAAVIAGAYTVPLNGGASADITVEITPTKTAAIGTWINCEILVKRNALADKLAIELERVR